jgi:hypothetical protein
LLRRNNKVRRSPRSASPEHLKETKQHSPENIMYSSTSAPSLTNHITRFARTRSNGAVNYTSKRGAIELDQIRTLAHA